MTQRLAEVAAKALLVHTGLEHAPRARGWIAAAHFDIRGRVIAYIFSGEAPGVVTRRSTRAVARSVNAALIRSGAAYLTAYSSQSPEHRKMLRALADGASRRRRGVWAVDQSRRGVLLRSEGSLGRRGALVLPKLFRRSVQFFGERFGSTKLLDWFAQNRQFDDALLTAAAERRRLSDVLVQSRDGRLRLRSHSNGLCFVDR